ncbi:MAG: CD225/dispanin family protein [Oryzihumus sp.]
MSDYGQTPPPPPPPPPAQGMPGQGPAGAPPKNYLVQSILACILCCVPLGIVAIVFASQVNSKWQAGDYAGSQQASQRAKTWTIVTVVVGIIAIAIAVPFQLNAAKNGMATN